MLADYLDSRLHVTRLVADEMAASSVLTERFAAEGRFHPGDDASEWMSLPQA
jgi:hypothetical protein